MTNIVRIGPFRYTVDGDGFLGNHAMDDYDKAVSMIEDELKSLPQEHHDGIKRQMAAWLNGEGAKPLLIEHLEHSAWATATEGWHTPDDAWVCIGMIVE